MKPALCRLVIKTLRNILNRNAITMDTREKVKKKIKELEERLDKLEKQ